MTWVTEDLHGYTHVLLFEANINNIHTLHMYMVLCRLVDDSFLIKYPFVLHWHFDIIWLLNKK